MVDRSPWLRAALVRAPLPLLDKALAGLLVTGLAVAPACRPEAAPAPVAPLADGRDYVQAASDPAAEPDAAPAPSPVVLALRAEAVDGRFDEAIPDDRFQSEYDPGDPWLGAEVPLVTLVAYLDYQCPYSRKLLATLYAVAELHPELRVVFKNFPLDFHHDARGAALASIAAQRQGRFWVMHDALFADQRALDRDALEAHAVRLGLDVERFRADLADPAVAARLDEEIAQAKRISVRGTPAMFVNGRSLTGALPLETLSQEVRAELDTARALVERGARPEALYAHFMHAATARAAAKAPSTDGRSIADDVRRTVSLEGLPRRGPEDAAVVIVECADFDCPFCRKVVPTLDALLDAHPGDVALLFRHMPLAFHKGAEPAARAAVAAQEQGKFWEMHDLLFAQPPTTGGTRSDAELERLAKKAGLNVKKWRKAFHAEATAKRVQAEAAARQANDVRGTPGFLINGRKVSGARPLADFEAVVREELERRP